MEELRAKFPIVDQLKLSLINNLKLIKVFEDSRKKINVFATTYSEEIYACGGNTGGILGLDPKKRTDEPTIVEELRGKSLTKFQNSSVHMVALTSNGKIFCWGNNKKGVIGNGFPDGLFYKPLLNTHLDKENVIDICCGLYHTLALTNENKVYAWGANNYGQLGIGDQNPFIPILVDGLNDKKIEAISCGALHSMALTDDGLVYGWGSNEFEQLGKGLSEKCDLPTLLKLNGLKILKISCGEKHSLLLSVEKDVYVFGKNYLYQKKLIEKMWTNPVCLESDFKLKNENKFDDIATYFCGSLSMALCKKDEKVTTFVWGKGKVKEKKNRTFADIFRKTYRITYENINLIPEIILDDSDDEYDIDKKDISVKSDNNKNSDKIPGQEKPTYDERRFEREFEKIKYETKNNDGIIDRGSFGIVYKALHRLDGQIYAVKKISFEGRTEEEIKKAQEELKILAGLKYDHIVEYKFSWMEFLPDTQFGTLYIQMELCDYHLGGLLEINLKNFNRIASQPMCEIEFYITCELFKELFKGVNFLHQHKPPIIHRDLKPENVLISKTTVKISDFGLAAYHLFGKMSHTEDKGTIRYIAPEVSSSRNYDTKADIYSLGVIFKDAFNLDGTLSWDDSRNNSALKERYEKIQKMQKEMTSYADEPRPNCVKLIKNLNLLALNLKDLESNESFNNLKTKIQSTLVSSDSVGENFSELFIKKKLSHI